MIKELRNSVILKKRFVMQAQVAFIYTAGEAAAISRHIGAMWNGACP